MVIDWLGHSCFKVTIRDGLVVLFDPFDASVGYVQQDVSPDVVVVSHDHYDHSDLSHVSGDYKVVNTAGMHEFGNVTIECIPTYHDHSGGANRGINLVSVLSVRGITLAHLGDIGCVPDADVLDKLQGLEILLIPVGGNYTVDAGEALQICDALQPNVIIPMHFKTPDSTLDIAPLHDFLEATEGEYDVSYPGKNYLEIDKASLKKRTRIVVMEYI